MQVMSRFGEVQFSLGWIDRNTHGMWKPDGSIIVNAIPSICDTVIHEILHDMDPNASEALVKSRTTRLMNQLSDQEMITLYTEFSDRATDKET